MFKKILVALDWSEVAQSILPPVRTLASGSNAEVILLHVVQDPQYEDGLGDTMVQAPLGADAATIHFEYRGYLDAAAAALKEAGINARVVLRVGRAADTILACADDMQADVIAMSTHARGVVPRLLMGSVADEVLHRARIPVLLVRPQAVSEPSAPAPA